jgi:hypothetical protein
MTIIEKLYQTFGVYTLADMHYCDCGCIQEEDIQKMVSTSLQTVDVEALGVYHGSAISTWGDVRHYQYYLPRILELHYKRKSESWFDLDDIRRKLDYASWQNWKKTEIDVLREFIQEDWLLYLSEEKVEVRELEVYAYFLDTDALISLWYAKKETTIKALIRFIYYYGNILDANQLKTKEGVFDFSPLIEDRELIPNVEKIFFEVCDTNPNFGSLVSVVLQWLEQQDSK